MVAFEDRDLEFYLTCFLKALERATDITQLKDIYKTLVGKLDKFNLDLTLLDLELKEIMSPNIAPSQTSLRVFKALQSNKAVDFKDSARLVEFLLKALILQKRWMKLRTQRIGRTFVSGKKPNIIKELARTGFGNISDAYNRLDAKLIGYSRFAFSKSLRAFRTIGLLGVNMTQTYGSTKIRDNLIWEKTLSDKIHIWSSNPQRAIINGHFTISHYLNDLSRFIETFGAKELVDILNESMKTSWFGAVTDMPEIDIDDIELKDVITEK